MFHERHLDPSFRPDARTFFKDAYVYREESGGKWTAKIFAKSGYKEKASELCNICPLADKKCSSVRWTPESFSEATIKPFTSNTDRAIKLLNSANCLTVKRLTMYMTRDM